MDFAAMHCSIARTLDVVGESWTPLLVRDLYLGVDRFDDLVRDLGISRALLARRLDRLATHGVVERVAYQERPVRYRYRLSESGRALVPLVMAMMAWGDRWATPPGGPPMRLRHAGCGAETTPTVCCSACGEPLDADEVDVAPGPGAAAGPGTRVLAERFGGTRPDHDNWCATAPPPPPGPLAHEHRCRHTDCSCCASTAVGV